MTSASGYALPPLHNLPHWSRSTTLDKARYPKPFMKDRIQVLPHPPNKSKMSFEDSFDLPDTLDMDPAQRIQYLERSLEFLKQQHQEVLKSLHEEIDNLKRDNKDLHFRVVMAKGLTPKELSAASLRSRETSGSSHRSQAQKLDELKKMLLEEEIENLRSNDAEAAQQTRPQSQLQIAVEALNPSMEPFQVHPKTQQARPPTLEECELIIRHLQRQSDKQTHELMRLKADLKDVLYSHKWTPDAYLLAKAYVATEEGDLDQLYGAGRLPKIPFKGQSRKLPDAAFHTRDHVSLPALKQTMGNKVVDRKKRVEGLKKQRQRKEVVL